MRGKTCEGNALVMSAMNHQSVVGLVDCLFGMISILIRLLRFLAIAESYISAFSID